MRKLGTTPPKETTLDGWVKAFEANGVERVVFTGRQCDVTGEHDVGNEYVSEVARRFPGRVIGFAGINPLHGMRSVKAIEYAVRSLGLKGISIDPFGGLVQANDPRLYPVYAKCAEPLDIDSVPHGHLIGPPPAGGWPAGLPNS